MKKKMINAMCAALSISFLAGCGLLTDDKNYNFSKDGVSVSKEGEQVTEVFSNKNKSAEIYYDVSDGMAEVVKDSRTQRIVQDSADAITKTWNDVSITVFSVGPASVDEEGGVSYVNNLNSITYAGHADDALMRSVESNTTSGNKVIVPRIKLIVTDLRGQLNSYQQLASDLSDKVIGNHQSLAILSVKTDTPFFIFAIGALNDLSDYLNTFYSMPNVTSMCGYIDWEGADREYNINCKIYAQNSGIEGIDYDKIELVEKGTFEYDANGNLMNSDSIMDGPPPMGESPIGGPGGPGGPPPMGGPGGQPPMGGPGGQPPMGGPGGPGGIEIRYDDVASFSILRPDYRPADMKQSVEGTVNFFPETQNTIELAVPENVDKQDISVDDIRYFGFKSMLWNKADILNELPEKESIAGKIKINIPFSIMSQIQLSNLEFGVSTNYYDAQKKDGAFYDSDKYVKDNIEVAFAGNDGKPHGNTFRIDNVNKTAMVNIYVKDLNELTYATKLDLIFNVSDPGRMPEWVQSWSMRSEYKNLQNFISLMNDYNKSNNKFNESLTVYILAGDQDSYDSVKVEKIADTK